MDGWIGRPRWRLVAAAVLVAASVLACWSHPAAASTTGVGTFSGSVSLPAFPCTNCIAGTFAGTATLSLSGTATTSQSNGVPVAYTAVWASNTTTNATAGFSFNEICPNTSPLPPYPGPPVTGTASGTFYLTGGSLSLNGGPLMSADLNGHLEWLREGTAVRLLLSTLVITAPSGGSTVAVNLNDLLQGESPTGFVWTNGPGTCAVPQTNQTAVIQGIDLQPV